MADPNLISDIDSLFRLPLEPLAPLFQSPSLAKTVLTKERILDPAQGAAVEFFRSKKSGGGVRSIADTTKELNLSKRDNAILKAFAALPSYDPYSLRTALRETIYKLNQKLDSEGVVLTLPSNLPLFELTADMQLKLSEYTRMFTRPLVHLILSGSSEAPDDGVETPADLIKLVQHAREHDDQETLLRLRQNLVKVGGLIGSSDLKRIEVELSAYGDAVLSLGYLKRYYFEVFVDSFWSFRHDIDTLDRNKKLQEEVYGLSQVLKFINLNLKESMGVIEDVLKIFDQRMVTIWKDTTPDQFLFVRTLIIECHDHLASLLCGWGTRVESWKGQVESRCLQSPNAQADYIIHNIRPGIEALPTAQTLGRLISKLGG